MSSPFAGGSKGLAAFSKEHPEAKTLVVGSLLSWQELIAIPVLELADAL